MLEKPKRIAGDNRKANSRADEGVSKRNGKLSGVIGRSKAIKSYLSRLLPMHIESHLGRLLSNLTGLSLAALGSFTLAWVGWLIWYDMTMWGKDFPLVFFGSRTGEAISLGIGMKVMHYFLVGLALFLSGSLTVFRRQNNAIKLYLSRLSHTQPRKEKERKNKKDSPVKPPEKEGKSSSGCLQHFGYLASRPKNVSVPQECLICPKILECIHVETSDIEFS